MKKILSMLFVCAILLSASLSAHAGDGSVIYDGQAQQFIFKPGSHYSPTDLFPDFKDVMPGDVLRWTITVKNDASRNVKVKIYLRSLGADADSEQFLSQLNLTATKSENNEMAYMFDAAASETAQLTDWVCLGTLYSGGVVNLDVVLNVPTELDNAFQSKVGRLKWEFKVEEFPTEDSDPVAPPTSDSLKRPLRFVVILFPVFVIILLLVWQKRTKRWTA